MTNPNQPVTINAAFLQEIKEVNQDLWRLIEDLRQMCAAPLSIRRQSRHLVDALAVLRDQLAMHFSLEEAYGYFIDPLQPDPQVAALADSLRKQHRTLYTAASQLADHAENLYRERDDATLTTVLPISIENYLQALMIHESEETDLIYRAMYEDIGVAD